MKESIKKRIRKISDFLSNQKNAVIEIITVIVLFLVSFLFGYNVGLKEENEKCVVENANISCVQNHNAI